MAKGDLVLLVDPDRALIEDLAGKLREQQFRVATVFDGESALSQCRQEMPKVVVTEGLIPKLDGLKLAREIRKLPDGPNVPIMLISAIYSSPKFQSEVESAGISAVMAKPFSSAAFIGKVRSLMLAIESPVSNLLQSLDRPFEPAGSLSEMPFVRLIHHLYGRREAGTLRVENEATKKLVTFDNGEPRFVVSNLEAECLGQVLVKKGRLTASECQKSLDLMKQLKKRQGEALIEMGILEPYELDEALKMQAREKFLEIFGWRTGKYVFVPGKVFRKELTAVDLSLAQLCLRGVKEHYHLAELETELQANSKLRSIFSSNPPFSIEDFKLAAWDQKILQQIKFGKPLGEILKLHLARDVDVYHLFYTFLMLGMMTFVLPKSHKRSA